MKTQLIALLVRKSEAVVELWECGDIDLCPKTDLLIYYLLDTYWEIEY